MVLVPLWLSVLTGCGEDPVLEAAREEAGLSNGAGPGEPGRPGEPAPGVPDEPPPGGDHAPGEVVPPGEVVLVRGSIVASGAGEVVIDVFDGDHAAGGANLVGRKKLAGAGDYELKVPADSEVWISAYMDTDGDGKPSPTEPKGSAQNPVSTGDGIEGLDLLLQ